MKDKRKSQKYHQIISTARKLFWKHGIRRVTVNEISTEAGVSKMTFYRFFDNKIELAKIVLEEIFEDYMQKYRDIMAQDIPFPEKIKQTILLKMEGTQEISQELIRDIYKNEEPELLEFMAEKRRWGMDEVLRIYAQGQQKGWLRKDIKPQFIIYFINKITDMVTDEALLALYKSQQELIMELTNFFFYGISHKDEVKP